MKGIHFFRQKKTLIKKKVSLRITLTRNDKQNREKLGILWAPCFSLSGMFSFFYCFHQKKQKRVVFSRFIFFQRGPFWTGGKGGTNREYKLPVLFFSAGLSKKKTLFSGGCLFFPWNQLSRDTIFFDFGRSKDLARLLSDFSEGPNPVLKYIKLSNKKGGIDCLIWKFPATNHTNWPKKPWVNCKNFM